VADAGFDFAVMEAAELSGEGGRLAVFAQYLPSDLRCGQSGIMRASFLIRDRDNKGVNGGGPG